MHGQCALVDSVNKMSRTAMVACIQALDGAAGVKRATPKGNKATIKQRLQEMREAADVFVPFAFEVGGALGSEAEAFLRECTAVAEWKNQGVGDLAHWSSMTWGEHWRQRIDVEIARGVARCVERAATGGWASSGTGRGCSHEYDPDCG